MPDSDQDLIKRRSADEYRYLREHVAALRSDPEIIEATKEVENATPEFTADAFQSGVFIDGFPCRLTIGTLSLLRAAESRMIGYGDKTSPASDYDIALAVFLLSDETRNLAVSVIADEDELDSAVNHFAARLNIKAAAGDLFEFLRRASHAYESVGLGVDPETGESAASVWNAPDDAWSDDVDLIAHEYGWMDNYILWELPLIRFSRLRDSIAARRSGKPRSGIRADSSLKLLQMIEEKGNALKEAGK